MQNMNERIVKVNIEDEMQRAYIDYSMSVIVGRALPDARDGMKPGNRRILFAMKERGWYHNKSYVKCAKVVGEVIGNFHPHGDTAVYDTLVRMAQEFAQRYQLIDGQGNFGSIDGDRAAAYRYTECKLRPQSEEMLADIEKDTVNMRPNFDESRMEPEVLPARLPNLLINGGTGIAVGMATNIPPHNLGEIIDATIHLIDNPESQVADLRPFVHGPDFPTGGLVCGFKGIADFYETGRGKMKMRGVAEIEEDERGKERIVITEIPYAVNKATLIQRMAELVHNKVLEGISDIRDESNKNGIRVVIELKRNAVSKVLLNGLFKHTALESTFGGNMLAIDHGKPRLLNLVSSLQCFIDHRFEVITRRTRFELNKAQARAHILEGFLKAMDNMDEVVRIIRASKNRDEAQDSLIERFEFSEIQAKAILDMRLYQLTGLERDKVQAEYDELMVLINYLQDLLDHPEKIYGVMKDDLSEMRAKYGDARRTQIVADEAEINIKDLIADAPCVITLSSSGYIKRMANDVYRQQRRGGKGVIGMNTKDEDFVEHVFSATTHDTLLCFTEGGRLYWLQAYQVPEGSRISRGRSIANLLEMEPDEKLASIICVRDFSPDRYVVMATKNGTIKKTALDAFKNIRTRGIWAINILDGDQLIGVKLTNGINEIVLSTKAGKAIRFSEEKVRAMGRTAAGVRGIKLQENNEVVSLAVIDPEATLLTVTENGFGKRTSFDEYRETNRGGQGIRSILCSERNGEVVAGLTIMEDQSLMIISESGQMICIGVEEVRIIGRSTQGVRLVNLKDGDRIVSVAPIATAPEEEEETEAAEGETAEGTEAPAEGAAPAPEAPAETTEAPEAPETE